MAITLVILSISVLLLLVALALGAIALVDANARVNLLTDMLRNIEEIQIRGSEIVYQKFGYRVPFSDSYLRLEEMKLEESKRLGGEK